MNRQPKRIAGLLGVPALLAVMITGCGFNAEQQLADALAAAGRTVLDQWLTDLANAAADARDQQAANDNDSQPSDNVNDNEPPDNTNDNDGGNDPVALGAAIVEDNCAACHGADGASGFAPNIQGADATTIGEYASGTDGHLVVELSEQEIADVEAYLASFAGDDGGGSGSTGDAVAGEVLLADNCAACHGADGASGFAPNIQGAAEAVIAERPGGGGDHILIELTEQEIADIAAFLAGF